MIPTLEGIIARRVLLNFRADPKVVRRLVPEPLEVAIQNGAAMIGVCLIRLEQLRPKGLPAAMGISSENMAHRVAVRYPSENGMREGVFVWRRETDFRVTALLGGRLFPGVHQLAEFHAVSNDDTLTLDVRTKHGEADVRFQAHAAPGWEETPAFKTFDEACAFFKRGDCGFSCSLDKLKLEGIQLKTLKWEMIPLSVREVSATFYENTERFPESSVEYDNALLMRGLPHEWHELNGIPMLAEIRT